MKLINAIVLNLIYVFPYAAGSDSNNVRVSQAGARCRSRIVSGVAF